MVMTIRVHRHGGPEVLTVEDRPVGPPGPGQVHLRQHAIGLNFVDIYHREGLYPNALPFVPGSEGAGKILAVGSGVTDVREGDRVAYGTAIGAYAAERLIAAEKLVKLPADVSYEVGAAAMLKGLTAQYLLRQTYQVGQGTVMLVQAAAGAIGLILCQWGAALGATVIGTAGTPDKAALAKAHGAQHVILYRDEDFVAAVRELTGGSLCDVVYDGVGRATFPAALDCVKPRGLFVSFGSASGTVEAFNLGLLAQKGSLFVTRPTLASYASDRPRLLAMAADLFGVLSSGDVKVEVHNRFGLKDVADAHRALAARETSGASILLPDG